MIGLLLRPIRQRRAIKALRARSDAADAFRQAKVRGDTRAVHETQAALTRATTDLLRAEVAMNRGRA